jgi:LysM domain
MPSLTEHLRRPGDHGRLPFHPECPVCLEERLAGKLPSDALLGPRTPALLAAGVLALSTAAPATALAQEPEQEQEGAVAPDPNATDKYEGDLPVDAPEPAPEWQETPDPDAGAPDDVQPTDEAPAADAPADEVEPATVQEPAEPPVDAPPPAVPEVPAPAPVEAPAPTGATPPAAPTSAPAAQLPIGKASSGPPLKSFVEKPARNRPAPTAQSSPVAPAKTAAAVPTTPSAAADTALVTVASSRSHAARQGDREHVVAPGESLWSIAADLLGGDASVAQTAREVNRLWELNSDRIGTGNPDLLMAGTKLALR